MFGSLPVGTAGNSGMHAQFIALGRCSPAPPPHRLEDPYWGVGVDMTLEEETKKWFPTSNSSKEVRLLRWWAGAGVGGL